MNDLLASRMWTAVAQVLAAALGVIALSVIPASAKCKETNVSTFAENYKDKEITAREEAVSSWEDKTRDLYGKGWAYWTKSADPTLVCKPFLKSSVVCTATARPCFYPLGQ
jgi:hypothetical protein